MRVRGAEGVGWRIEDGRWEKTDVHFGWLCIQMLMVTDASFCGCSAISHRMDMGGVEE